MRKGEFYSKGYYAGLAPEPRFQEVLAIVGKLKGERLLDIGCGDGAFTVQLKEALGAKEAIGIEIAPEAVPAIEKRGIKAYQLDIDEKPFPFDRTAGDCFRTFEGMFQIAESGKVLKTIDEDKRKCNMRIVSIKEDISQTEGKIESVGDYLSQIELKRLESYSVDLGGYSDFLRCGCGGQYCSWCYSYLVGVAAKAVKVWRGITGQSSSLISGALLTWAFTMFSSTSSIPKSCSMLRRIQRTIET